MARRKEKPRPAKAAVKRRSRKSAPAATRVAAKAAKRSSEDTIAAPAEPEGPTALTLPETLDSASASSIKDLLLARRGTPVVVDASQVRRTGMQAVQILISAAQTWQADGQKYFVANPTQEFIDTLALVGVSREQLSVEGYPG